MMSKFIGAIALCVALAACGSKTNGNSAPVELTKAEFFTRVANYESSPTEFRYLGDKPAIVDFYAPWCGPCRTLAPILEELAAEYGDRIVIYKVNTDNEPELAAAFGVQSLPTLLFIPMDGDPQMAQGALPKEELKQVIEQMLQ